MLPIRVAEEVSCCAEIPGLLDGSFMHRSSCLELSIILQCFVAQIKFLAIMFVVYFGMEILSSRSTV